MAARHGVRGAPGRAALPHRGPIWPGAAAPERDEAAAKGYLQAVPACKIVLAENGQTEDGKARGSIARVAGAVRRPVPRPAAAPRRNGNGQRPRPLRRPRRPTHRSACPKCGGPMWDNRASKKNPAAPDFKLQDRRLRRRHLAPEGADPATATAHRRRPRHQAPALPLRLGFLRAATHQARQHLEADTCHRPGVAIPLYVRRAHVRKTRPALTLHLGMAHPLIPIFLHPEDTMLPQIQVEQARQRDLLHLVEPDTTLIRIASTHGGEYAGPCPFCGGTDRFHVVPGAGKWYCRHCTPRGGDAIDYVQRREQVAFQAAIEFLAGHTLCAPTVHTHPARRDADGCSAMDAACLAEAAQTLVHEAEVCLADDAAGAAARAYLAGRGLRPATWQAWRLGFHLAWQPVRREALPAITLPWFGADGLIQAVQYRYFGPGIARHERFGQKAGGQRSLFGLPRLAGWQTLIITEGELNAISCWQVAHDWADVLSIGSQESARQARVSEALQRAVLPYRQVMVWLDERELALAVTDRIAPFNGAAVWSQTGLDANDLLQRGLLAARLANAMADARMGINFVVPHQTSTFHIRHSTFDIPYPTPGAARCAPALGAGGGSCHHTGDPHEHTLSPHRGPRHHPRAAHHRTTPERLRRYARPPSAAPSCWPSCWA